LGGGALTHEWHAVTHFQENNMECRICHQSIGFLRGRFPERKKTTTLAVHETEMPRLLQQVSCVVVNPHPGAQRKLRQELEAHHSSHVMQPASNSATNGDLNHASAAAEAAEAAGASGSAGSQTAAASEAESGTERLPVQEPERAEARAHVSR
jgi:hypothetical protein